MSSNDPSLPLQTDAAATDEAKLLPAFVVGIGASAGGLEALERFFKAMPVQSGMAFVVIQHLSPDFKSLMDELLARFTTMAIHRVEAPVEMRPNTIYLLPPRKEMTMEGNSLRVQDKPSDHQLNLPINTFFRSLAREQADKAVAIVLSGTGSDGSQGILDVHDTGGLVIVQSEESAKFDGMPRSALATGRAAAVLAPEEMPAALLSYASNPSRRLLEDGTARAAGGLSAVFDRLKQVYELDFNLYKPATISRRLDRRVSLGRPMVTLEAYCAQVLDDPDELDLLYKDLLIGVTRFFRDPEAFAILRDEVIPGIFNQNPEAEIRVWVPGCATGEEPYSLAMLFLEEFARRGRAPTLKIFATDVHRDSLKSASDEVYPLASLEGLPAGLREKYFVEAAAGHVRVTPQLRKLVVFSPHNVLRDPPFTRIDLVSCRNLLIYFQPMAQTKAIGAFYFSLRPKGVLFLGPSESLGGLANEFESINRHWKIYRKITDHRLSRELRPPMVWGESHGPRPGATGDQRLTRVYDALLSRYVPTGLLVNERREVLHVFGDADRFLRPPVGRVSHDLLAMARDDLRIALSSALQSCQKRLEKVTFRAVHVRDEQGIDTVIELSVEPLPDKQSASPTMLVLFRETGPAVQAMPAVASLPADAGRTPVFDLGEGAREHITALEDEVRHAKESLQTAIEELETSNEELQASNEELLASNEELQSTNEELHSVNEELHSVNAEHELKIQELDEATGDLRNLIQATAIGTIFTDDKFCIRLFTPTALAIFNLLPQDVGRDIRHITSRVKDDNVFEQIATVSATGGTLESRIVTPEGCAYLRHIKPYISLNGRPGGLILTFVDITQLSLAESAVRASEEQFRLMIEHAPEGILMADSDGRIVLANAQLGQFFGYKPEELVGQPLEVLIPESLRKVHERHRTHYAQEPSGRRMGVGRELMARHRDGREIPIEVGLSPIQLGGRRLAIAFVNDITLRKQADASLRASEARFRTNFEHAGIGMAVISADGHWLEANRVLCGMLGYSEETLRRMTFQELTHPDDRHVDRDLFPKLLTGEIPVLRVETRYRRADGEYLWVRVNSVVVRDEEGHPLQFISQLENITELKRAEAERREIESKMIETAKLESLGVLAGGIAHDFNNILTGILGYASLGSAEVTPDSPFAETFAHIEVAAVRASDLCKQMLAYAGRAPSQTQAADLGILLQETADLVRHSIGRNIELSFDITPALPPVEVDSSQIRQVLMNLMINAAEAIGDRDGRIACRCFPLRVDDDYLQSHAPVPPVDEGEFVAIEIEDTGCGIKPENIRRIFEPFFTTKFTGRGLGLAATHGIMRTHRGGLEIASVVNEGTTFKLLLPVAIQSSKRAVTLMPFASVASGRGRTVLLIDDENQVLGPAQKILEKQGWRCQTASNGPSGVEIFAANPAEFALVMLDMTMPGWDGVRTLAELRKRDPGVRVLLMSGFSKKESLDRCGALKPDGFLQKPFLRGGLLQAVEAACAPQL